MHVIFNNIPLLQSLLHGLGLWHVLLGVLVSIIAVDFCYFQFLMNDGPMLV